MKISYLFDVDGTLTEPRQRMDNGLSCRFLHWAQGKCFFLVTGSDRDKLFEQLPSSILSRASGVFTSMANELRVNGRIIYENKWEPPIELLTLLISWRMKSPYPDKRPVFLEHRVGMLNFSVAGRKSNVEERNSYHDWDRLYRERETIAKDIEKQFPRVEAKLGGQISIDIQPKGNNKSLASKWVRKTKGGEIIFFGDKCNEGGNDYDIVQDIVKNGDGRCYPVKNSLETFELLDRI
jgi:phosphomannomutase